MILTNCAACAAPLAHDAPRCVRCKTRYCNSTCQHDHWRRGHKQICKKIHRGGNAEQYHADNKYKEAVAAAAEDCAEDTKGQTCYICTEALHWKTKEGLVRRCACRGTSGFAHVSCLAEQAKILVEEAEENNLDYTTLIDKFDRWTTCSLCEQEYHGVVRRALGWACWKTYRGQPETEHLRWLAMVRLGAGLHATEQYAEALVAFEGFLSNARRMGQSEDDILPAQTNVANCYWKVGREDEALSIERHVFARQRELNGGGDEDTIISAMNLANSLNNIGCYEETINILRGIIPAARDELGPEHIKTFSKNPSNLKLSSKNEIGLRGKIKKHF
jgi:tetratricopeptide (TPR) repeat protein